MKMHLLPCGRLRMRKSIFLPAAGRGETIELPVEHVSTCLAALGLGSDDIDVVINSHLPGIARRWKNRWPKCVI